MMTMAYTYTKQSNKQNMADWTVSITTGNIRS